MSTTPDIDALLVQMDAERQRPGVRCLVCQDGSPVLRAFVRLARDRGHSYTTIANKVLQTWPDTVIRVGSIRGHLVNHHDA
jgi:hypothetical protein